jgi:hypothetical protein
MKQFTRGWTVGSTGLPILAVVVGFAACGPATSDPSSEFIGSWAENGQELITCNGTAQPATAINDTFTVNRGVDAPLSIILMNPSCVLRADAAENTATLLPAQMCSTTAMGVTVTVTLTSGTFSLSNATSGTVSMAGTAMGTASNGLSVQCTMTSTTNVTKVGQ